MDNIVCMKWGSRYSPEYVNILADSVRRHMVRPYRFVCFTEDAEGITPDVEIRPLPHMELNPELPERGWRKLTMFQASLADLEGTALFLDLDIVVMNSLDPFFDVPGGFRIIKDWNLSGSWIGNSSVFRFEIGKHQDVLDYYVNNGNKVRKAHRNEQAYLSWAMKKKGLLEYWDPDWCVSFKRSCIRSVPMSLFIEPKRPSAQTRIVVFHGSPNPHQVLGGWSCPGKLRFVRPTAWIGDNWRRGGPASGEEGEKEGSQGAKSRKD